MLKKLNNSKLFEEIYCLVLCIISLFCWYFSGVNGLVAILIISTVSLIAFNDFKYIIPCLTYFLFINNTGFAIDEFPILLIISGFIFIFILLIFIIKNGIHLSKAKSSSGLAILSFLCFIPLFWHNVIEDGQEVLYFMYLAYFLYFLIYLLFATSLSKNSFSMLVASMSYLGVLLACECGIKIIELSIASPETPILDHWYYLGWGLCNEAGIMMCVSLPFIFIELGKSNNMYKLLGTIAKIGIVAIGMFLTTSRGTLLFGFIEIILLFLWTMYTTKYKKTIATATVLLVALSLIFVQIIIGIPRLLEEIKETIFSANLDDNGRVDLWTHGINMWNSNMLTRIFGAGTVSEFYVHPSYNGEALVYMVYHSTLLQALANFGIVGVITLGYHFFEKYRQIFKFDRRVAGLLLIGYIVVDLYGMIDNTYGMYYYMIPLVIMMASIDTYGGSENELNFGTNS